MVYNAYLHSNRWLLQQIKTRQDLEMAVGILLITHWNIGGALKDTVASLLNDSLPTRLENCAIPWQANPDTTLVKAQNLCAEMDSGDGVLVLTDMYGSTPANISRRLINNCRVRIICGLNLAMLLKSLNYCHLGLDEVAEKALLGGRNSMMESK